MIIDNARLRETLADIYEENGRLSRQTSNDARVIAELKKILEIEGLLSRYGNLFGSSPVNEESAAKRFPVNDYSGLNKLRARLKGYHLPEKNGSSPDVETDKGSDNLTDFIDGLFASDGNGDSTTLSGAENILEPADGLSDSLGDLANDSQLSSTDAATVQGNDEYLSLILSGKRCIGSPILFFFQLGTSTLTDPSQLVNLDEIARVAKKYGLAVRVTGAADSATGTTTINKGLGNDRADYIINQLQDRGIRTSLITKINQGGIDLLSPDEANRHCKVELFVIP